MAATLTRLTSDTIPDTLHDLDVELADRAYHELDYRLPQRTITTNTLLAQLHRRLIELGFAAFNPAEVTRYQEKIANRKWWQMLGWMLTAIPLMGVGVAYLHNGWGALLVVAGALSLMLPAFIIEPINWEWHTVPLSHYSRPIPAHVLQTALQIKRAYPHGSLMVDEFHLKEKVADPFLVLLVGDGCKVYLEVWDEPTFKATP